MPPDELLRLPGVSLPTPLRAKIVAATLPTMVVVSPPWCALIMGLSRWISTTLVLCSSFLTLVGSLQGWGQE